MTQLLTASEVNEKAITSRHKSLQMTLFLEELEQKIYEDLYKQYIAERDVLIQANSKLYANKGIYMQVGGETWILADLAVTNISHIRGLALNPVHPALKDRLAVFTDKWGRLEKEKQQVTGMIKGIINSTSCEAVIRQILPDKLKDSVIKYFRVYGDSFDKDSAILNSEVTYLKSKYAPQLRLLHERLTKNLLGIL
jgi:hypothetical protein